MIYLQVLKPLDSYKLASNLFSEHYGEAQDERISFWDPLQP